VDANRRLLVLGAGRQQLGLLQAARQQGLLVVAVDRDSAAPGFRLADRRALISSRTSRRCTVSPRRSTSTE